MKKRLMKKTLIILCVCTLSVFAGDFEDGWKAYDAQNYKQAVALYQKAADQGYALAQTNLGLMYYKGQGVKQSDVKAKVWFGKACDNGDADGCKNYAILNKR